MKKNEKRFLQCIKEMKINLDLNMLNVFKILFLRIIIR